jgi:two-component system alkaline phosphatase synthesis response regulator PhoP
VVSLLTSALRLNSAIPFGAAASPKKILIVDDDPVILKTMSSKLRSRGYATVTAIDASEAISAVRDELPDLIILDINFPPDVAHGGLVAWDGFQIMSWVRGLSEAGTVPIIFITGAGADSVECENRSVANGAVALFHKPIAHKEIIQVIRNSVG